jgi:hypothetical protein
MEPLDKNGNLLRGAAKQAYLKKTVANTKLGVDNFKRVGVDKLERLGAGNFEFK